jgi:hypothetical protein
MMNLNLFVGYYFQKWEIGIVPLSNYNSNQEPDCFHSRPPHSQGPMNRPYFQPPHHQGRFNQSGPLLPPPGRGTLMILSLGHVI